MKRKSLKSILLGILSACCFLANAELTMTSVTSLRDSKILNKYCFDCHSDGVDKGDIDFDLPLTQTQWSKVWKVIDKEQMPPAGKKQPSLHDRETILVDLESRVFDIDRTTSYSAPISVYRLSNKQFSKSMYHTFNYKSEVGQLLPLDPTSAGFNNIASSMSISPLLFERYKDIAFKSTRDMFLKDSGNHSTRKSGEQWLKKLGRADSESVRKLIYEVSRKAFRRIPSEKEVLKLVRIYNEVKTRSGSKRTALMETFRAIIISPAHIFRTELFGKAGQKGELIQLDEFALASRISFFLWNSPPDEYLLDLAEKKELRKKLPKVLNYMISKKRFKSFSESFGQQWLNIQFLENNLPNQKMFSFKRDFLRYMKTETTLFLNYLFKENRPIDDFFNSKVSFINGPLARRYGLQGFNKKDTSFKKITFPEDSHRQGLLTHPSVLIVTSDPDRTSPVKRGLWILESILAMPPPPAPANVPGIEEAKEHNASKDLTFKELLAIHRADKRCASCHNLMDPLGLAFENFDASGRWRELENGEKIIFNERWRGNEFKSFSDLQRIISGKYRGKFLKCLVEKMLTYALARELNIKDNVALIRIVDKIKSKETKYQEVLLEVIKSTPFQYRISGK